MSDVLSVPSGRFSLALPYTSGGVPKNTTLDPAPVWTSLDQAYPNLVTSYTIERGRQYELDRTDTGRATVSIADVDGILDPTNLDGPYAGKIEPLLQACLCRYDPVAGAWFMRYRGFVEDYDYGFDPSQQVNRLELNLVDLFEIVSSIEMHPGEFGVAPPSGSAGQIFYEDTATPSTHDGMQLRCQTVLGDCGIDDAFFVIFSGNIDVHETTYSPGESAMTAIVEAADAEFPGVANVFCDRFGRLCIHGRYARFDPVATAATLDDPTRWDFHDWAVGDGARVASHPTTTAHVRVFGFNRGLSKVLNRALATPIGIAETKIAGQYDADPVSVAHYGIRAWTTQNLLTKAGQPSNRTTDLEETKLFATWVVDSFAAPQNRIAECGFRSIHPSAVGAAATWTFLSKCDIGDRVAVYVGSPGGGGFAGEQFFVEGISEEVKPLNPLYDDVTLSLDLSPFAFFEFSPFPPASVAFATGAL